MTPPLTPDEIRKRLAAGTLRIECAPTDEIDQFDELADEFIPKIFDIDSFMITDESSISDFRDRTEPIEAAYQRIQEAYGIDVRDIKGGYLLDIFKRINLLRNVP